MSITCGLATLWTLIPMFLKILIKEPVDKHKGEREDHIPICWVTV